MLQNNVDLGYDYMLTWRDIRQGSDLELKMNIMTGATPAAITTSYTGTTHFAYHNSPGFLLFVPLFLFIIINF